jgi:hypothetical protein
MILSPYMLPIWHRFRYRQRSDFSTWSRGGPANNRPKLDGGSRLNSSLPLNHTLIHGGYLRSFVRLETVSSRHRFAWFQAYTSR